MKDITESEIAILWATSRKFSALKYFLTKSCFQDPLHKHQNVNVISYLSLWCDISRSGSARHCPYVP